MTDSSGGVKPENATQAKDPERFYCPFPGCNRSFAELWRLKVHYRAPPDIRGSGKERGHGTELSHCPKCGKTLKPGKHHVGCSAGRSAPRQATKRTRMSHPDASILDVALMQDGFQEETTIPDHIMQQLMGNAQQFCKNDPEPPPIPDFMHNGQQSVLAMPDIHQQQLNFQQVQQILAAGAADTHLHSQFADVQQQAQQQASQQQAQQQQQQQQTAPQQQQFPGGSSSAPFMPFNNNAGVAGFTQAAAAAPTLNLTLVDQGNLQNVFDYDEMENRVPSPPPLPPDFHDDEKGAGGFLFNFGQFSERLPSTVQPPPHPYELVGSTPSTSDQSWDNWSGKKICSQTTNDGDLMQILFGLPDEYPIMATSHLHNFENPNTPTPTSDSAEQQVSSRGMGGAFDFTDESPRFSSLLHGDELGQGLDMQLDRSDAGEFACSPTSMSMTIDNNSNQKSLLSQSQPHQLQQQQSQQQQHGGETGFHNKPLTISVKKVEDHSFHSETHLSPTALLKDTSAGVLPRICTFEQELYQLLRPCE